MIAYVFPGQGSQQKGMGGELFDRFADVTAKADAILGYSIRRLCLEDPDKQLGNTRYTQVALYVVNAMTYMERLRSEAPPAMAAGHSLGEYDALFAAGVFDFEAGLRLVQQRGELMARARDGGMAAVIGMDLPKLEAVLREQGADAIDVANYNAPSQTVLSGPRNVLESLVKPIEAAGARRCMILNVSAAFHSRYMDEAAREFASFLEPFTFAPPRFPVIANVTARPHDAEGVKALLAKQIHAPVQWTDSMRYLIARGVDAVQEIGPGTVLTNLFKTIQKEAAPLVMETPAASISAGRFSAESLGSAAFRVEYGVRYACVAGSMPYGISGVELVTRMSGAGMLSFFGTSGLEVRAIENAIDRIGDRVCGMSLRAQLEDPAAEEALVALFLRRGVRNVEASGYLQISAPLVWYRYKGARRDGDGFVAANRVLARVSHPEVAQAFMSPAPERLIAKLVEAGKLTEVEAQAARALPVSGDICVEADGGGPTTMGSPYALMPAITRLRDAVMKERRHAMAIRVGAAGGIGAPEAAAAALVLGAEFLVTGSINQCTPEAVTSDAVKDLLQSAGVQDADYAPAADLFELGGKVQVLKRGVFFPARARKLYELYQQYESLEAIDAKTRDTIQNTYFRRSFDAVLEELHAGTVAPKQKMAMVFKWYLDRAARLAVAGDPAEKVNYQVYCGPAMGAFNELVRGTELESWHQRHVDGINLRLMQEIAELLNRWRLDRAVS